jgi:hypothetical protein
LQGLYIFDRFVNLGEFEMMSTTATVSELNEAQRGQLQKRMRTLLEAFPALKAVDVADATRELLDEMASPRHGSSVTARAILRGYAEKEQLKSAEGGHISADEARAFLNLSKPALLDRFKKGRVLGWWEKNAVRFPVWQFAPEGGLLPGLEQALGALHEKRSYDEWAKVLFFLNPRHSLGDKRPLDLLREGRAKEVADLAGLDD